MSNVLIEKNKIDILANAISCKSGEAVTMTLDEMVEAVDGIDTSGITPTGNIDITSAGVTDVTNYATATVPEAEPTITTVYQYYTENGLRKWRYKGRISFEDGEPVGWISEQMDGEWGLRDAIATGTSVTPTESTQTIGGANVMMEGAVTVNAIPSNYVGSGITQRTSLDLSAGGATVSVPSGYYASNASKAVSSGTEGTPTATKGTVSNHSVTVTPSVTNSAGYISGGTKTGTAITVSASELVSGTYTVDSSGTKDVTNYASASVPAGTEGTPTATKGTVSNHSISVTPSVTNSSGFITGGTKTGTAVTVSANELVSGSETKTENGTYDVTNLAELVVDVSGGTAAISVVDTTDSAGGTIRTITALDISDTTATASDVASGKYFYTAAGVKTAGTGSGGGGGGLVYETGTLTPSSDANSPYIYFNDTHSTYPIYINIVDTTEMLASENSMLSWSFINWYDTYNSYFMGTSSANYYGRYVYQFKSSSGVSRGESEATALNDNSGGLYFLLTEAMFVPYGFGSSRYWRSGRTYKWIAVWAPTT